MTIRVLVIDDEPLIALDIEEAIVDAGLDVVGLARNAADALTFIERGGIDVVVLDGNLGGESAAPVAERLRSASVPFFVVSGYSAEQLDWLGETKLIKKPYENRELTALIKCLAQGG